MDAFYQEEYSMTHKKKLNKEKKKTVFTKNTFTLADAHGWMLAVERDEEAVQSDQASGGLNPAGPLTSAN